MRMSMAGGASLLAMALHVSVLVPTAISARSATAKCAAFVSISAESMGLGCCRIGKCAAVDKQRSALTMLSPPWATKPTPTIGGERMSPLRLRGGSLIEHCLPAVIRRRLMPTRTCFTRANAVLLDRDNWMPGTVDKTVPRVVFILGGPGAGKGTQCSKLTQEFRGVKHLSAGDLLRAERDSGSEQGAMINEYMKEGRIIPVKVTAGLLKQAIEREKGRCELFLIDGFPRNDDNLIGWNDIVGNSVHVEFMLLLECSEEVMLQRLVKRGAGSGRVDDNSETIKKRFTVYKTETLPVITYFKEQSRLQCISADSGSVDNVFSDIEKVFSAIATRKSLPRRFAEKCGRFVLGIFGWRQ